MNPPTLAIVTPSYNTGRYIGDAVRSVLGQDYPRVDYVVMDGGSTDGTVDVLRSFGPRLNWVSQKDKGQSDAINRGFARTRGDILGWLNSDDTYAPGAFRAVARVFAERPDVDLVYGDATYTDYQGRHVANCLHVEPFDRERLFQYTDFIVQPAAFFSRRIFEKVGGIDASIHWAMDYDLWLRIAAAGARVVYLRRVLAHFRWLADNKTATGDHGRLDEIAKILRRHGRPLPAYNTLERCNLYGMQVVSALAGRRWGEGARQLGQVARTLLGSPRAAGSLLSPQTWRIVHAGQVLRRRAAVEHEAMKARR